ncbi:23S rRNA accumulation protein YceD [Lysobacter sp. N42]|nr:23S rRNA accumulation protein YceD [Aliidiomarina sp. B3213]TCZ93431.1 23S rRNA accumulation protein YceD [Lysobacter sp. N42]
MQKVRIPVTVDPIRSATKRLSYNGEVPTASLERLQDVSLEIKGEADVCLTFDRDEQNLVFIHGTAETTVVVACQRCGENMDVPVTCEFRYAPVNQKVKAEDLPEHYDPVELNEFGELNLHQIVEDELILALPLVAMHAEEDCRIDRNTMTFGELPKEEDKPNPFAVLQKLKK